MHDAGNCWFIMLYGLAANPAYARNASLALSSRARPCRLKYLHGTPAYLVSDGFAADLLQCGDNPRGILYALSAILKADAIAAAFKHPDVWMLNQCAVDLKRKRREKAEARLKSKQSAGR